MQGQSVLKQAAPIIIKQRGSLGQATRTFLFLHLHSVESLPGDNTVYKLGTRIKKNINSESVDYLQQKIRKISL